MGCPIHSGSLFFLFLPFPTEKKEEEKKKSLAAFRLLPPAHLSAPTINHPPFFPVRFAPLSKQDSGEARGDRGKRNKGLLKVGDSYGRSALQCKIDLLQYKNKGLNCLLF